MRHGQNGHNYKNTTHVVKYQNFPLATAITAIN